MSRLFLFMLCFAYAIAKAAGPDAMPTDHLLAMGPDPGGHTGARVTPETTKTDRPEVDAARKATSGDKTESNPPLPAEQSSANSQGKSSKPAK